MSKDEQIGFHTGSYILINPQFNTTDRSKRAITLAELLENVNGNRQLGSDNWCGERTTNNFQFAGDLLPVGEDAIIYGFAMAPVK
jgi:hypothetical protein